MKQAAYLCIVITTALFALIYGESLMIPLVTAFLLWFLTFEIRKSLNKVSFFRDYLPNWIKNVVVFGLIVLVLWGVIEILTINVASLIASSGKYEANLQKVAQSVQNMFNIDVEQSINDLMGDMDFGSILSNLVNSLSGFLGNLMMILIYALFIFLEESSIKEKVVKAFDSSAQYERFAQITTKIENSVFDYLRLKTLVSLLTGGLSYVALLFVGLDSPLFWAFLIFLMNYIPTIGSLIATVFPALFSLVQFGTWTPFLIILLLVGAVQLVVGNIIEPRVMGKSLNVSPLVTIIALAIWGKIWGIAGMILSVPITVIMIIVFSQFKETQKVAILLTENGEVD